MLSITFYKPYLVNPIIEVCIDRIASSCISSELLANGCSLRLNVSLVVQRHDTSHPASYDPPRGLYGDSRFYPANGQYQIFNICNHWVAERLADAGLAINVTLASWPGLLRTDLSYRVATSSGD